MTTVYEYVTDKQTPEAVHLARQVDIAVEPDPHTLCGKPIHWATQEMGDETMSGIAATCTDCKQQLAEENA